MAKKMCSIFNCDRHRENRCCFTCLDYSRCGLAKDAKPKKERPAKDAHRKENVAT